MKKMIRRLPPRPSGSFMDTLARGESAITRVDSTLGRTQSAASRARSISEQPATKVALAIGVVAIIGVAAYYVSKQS